MATSIQGYTLTGPNATWRTASEPLITTASNTAQTINLPLDTTTSTSTSTSTQLPVIRDTGYRSGTRPALADDSPSLVSKEDVAAWAQDIDNVFQSQLGRNAGAVGHQYWTYDAMADTGALMDQGMSYEQAKARALQNLSANVGYSSERANFKATGDANASPLATGAGTWNPTNNPEQYNSPYTPGGELVTNDDGTRTFQPGPNTQATYTSVPLNQQPIQPVVYGGGGSNTTVVTGTGPQAKTAADQLRITPQDKVVLAGGNRLGDYSRQERKGRMGPIPGGRVGGGGVNIFG
tara:strand:- start:574 stop:1452 length:879 start_codon:yes stop_codon:yes gene_type:complete